MLTRLGLTAGIIPHCLAVTILVKFPVHVMLLYTTNVTAEFSTRLFNIGNVRFLLFYCHSIISFPETTSINNNKLKESVAGVCE